MADLVLFVGYVSVCNLLPSAAQPSPASLPGSPASLLPPLWGYVQEVSFSRAKGMSALKVFWLTCYFQSLHECQVDEAK